MAVDYLLASLPMLFFDRPPAVSVDAFTEACREQLSGRDADAAALLARGGSLDESDHPFVRAWAGREAILRNAVARRRLGARKAPASVKPLEAEDSDLGIERSVDAAFEGSHDPLAREKAIDRIRWQEAEALQGVDPISKRFVFAYAIQLAIASRWQSLSQEAGRKRVDAALPKATL